MSEVQGLVVKLCGIIGVVIGVASAADPIQGAITGLLIGGSMGLGLAILVSKKGDGSPPGMGGGRWITARYQGRCRRCGQTVYPGDRVKHFAMDRKVACRACGGA